MGRENCEIHFLRIAYTEDCFFEGVCLTTSIAQWRAAQIRMEGRWFDSCHRKLKFDNFSIALGLAGCFGCNYVFTTPTIKHAPTLVM